MEYHLKVYYYNTVTRSWGNSKIDPGIMWLLSFPGVYCLNAEKPPVFYFLAAVARGIVYAYDLWTAFLECHNQYQFGEKAKYASE